MAVKGLRKQLLFVFPVKTPEVKTCILSFQAVLFTFHSCGKDKRLAVHDQYLRNRSPESQKCYHMIRIFEPQTETVCEAG